MTSVFIKAVRNDTSHEAHVINRQHPYEPGNTVVVSPKGVATCLIPVPQFAPDAMPTPDDELEICYAYEPEVYYIYRQGDTFYYYPRDEFENREELTKHGPLSRFEMLVIGANGKLWLESHIEKPHRSRLSTGY